MSNADVIAIAETTGLPGWPGHLKLEVFGADRDERVLFGSGWKRPQDNNRQLRMSGTAEVLAALDRYIGLFGEQPGAAAAVTAFMLRDELSRVPAARVKLLMLRGDQDEVTDDTALYPLSKCAVSAGNKRLHIQVPGDVTGSTAIDLKVKLLRPQRVYAVLEGATEL